MNVKVVTVIGANGTMGRNVAGIFASFGEAQVYMVCRTLEKAETAKEQAALSVKAESIKRKLIPCTLDNLEECVEKSDLIFDSISENMEKKLALNARITKAARPDAVICTGSSGLSIQQLAQALRPEHRNRFMGLHLFNPPYNMTLCELTPSLDTDPLLVQEVKNYTQSVLRRTVVQVKDAPAFLGNRIGFQFINEAMQYAELYRDSGGIDYIDAILGQYSGRSMAPLNTANFVGLDIHKAIVNNLHQNTCDYSHDTFALPDFAQKLIENNRLGLKTGSGLYRISRRDDGSRRYEVFDLSNDTFRKVNQYSFPFKNEMIDALRVGDYDTARRVLVKNHSIEAKLCLEFLLKYIVYALYCAKELGESYHDADDVMAAGFNWAPPLSMIDFLGGTEAVNTLVQNRLGKDFCCKAEPNTLLNNLPKSRYDFRKFFKAKR